MYAPSASVALLYGQKPPVVAPPEQQQQHFHHPHGDGTPCYPSRPCMLCPHCDSMIPLARDHKPILAERFKTKMCKNFVEQGHCPYMFRCMFAHGDHELRTKQMNMADGLTTESAVKAFQWKEREAERAELEAKFSAGITLASGRTRHDPYAEDCSAVWNPLGGATAAASPSSACAIPSPVAPVARLGGCRGPAGRHVPLGLGFSSPVACPGSSPLPPWGGDFSSSVSFGSPRAFHPASLMMPPAAAGEDEEYTHSRGGAFAA